MNPTLPLVLLLQSNAPLDASDRRTIDRFSARWSVEFLPTRALDPADPPEGALPYAASDAIVVRVEALLADARLGVARLDENDSRAALDAAETLLAAHPELPQAAWLRAEQLTIAAELAEATKGAGAAALRRRAAALEGPRALPFRDQDPPPLEPTLESAVSVTVSGLGPRDALEWDGVRVTLPVRTRVGEHAARVLRRGFPIEAAWISVAEGTSAVALSVPQVRACSAEDLAGTVAERGGARAERGVACPRWAVARRERGELELSLCRHSECGRWYRLGLESRSAARQSALAPSSGLPAWVTVALAGAGAALATSFVLWQTGAFDAESHARKRWVYRGLELR